MYFLLFLPTFAHRLCVSSRQIEHYVWFRLDEFIEWIESKGYTFLGGVREMIDGKFPDPYNDDDDCEDEEDQDDG